MVARALPLQLMWHACCYLLCARSNFNVTTVVLVVSLKHPCYNHLTIQVTSPTGANISLLSPESEGVCEPFDGNLTLSGDIPASRRRVLLQGISGNSLGSWAITVQADDTAQAAGTGEVTIISVALPQGGSHKCI